MQAKDGLHARNLAYYLLWFEFLAMSPSYELARRCRAGQWGEDERLKQPADFDRVLKVYDDLGDVQNQTWRDWWLTRAFDSFGYPGKRPRVEHITQIGLRSQTPYFDTAASNYVRRAWHDQGQQRTLVVAIPVGLSRSIISRRINQMLDRIPEIDRKLQLGDPKYPLRDTNLHRHTYFRYLYVLWHRCAFPNKPLWQIGTEAKVSGT